VGHDWNQVTCPRCKQTPEFRDEPLFELVQGAKTLGAKSVALTFGTRASGGGR